MAKNINRIAAKLGATIVAEVHDVGGGAFGAARLLAVVTQLQERLTPEQLSQPQPVTGSADAS